KDGMEVRALPDLGKKLAKYPFERGLRASRDGSLLAGFANDKVIVIDAKSGAVRLRFDAKAEESVHWALSGKLLAVAIDTHIHLVDLTKKGSEVLRLYPLDTDDWVAAKPDGRFEGSAGAFTHLAWVDGEKKIPLDSFFDSFFAPGIVAEVLGG